MACKFDDKIVIVATTLKFKIFVCFKFKVGRIYKIVGNLAKYAGIRRYHNGSFYLDNLILSRKIL